MNDITIVQISDIHLSPAGKQPSFNQKLDPYVKLNMVFDDIRKIAVKPEFIVLTGDLIHEGTANDYVRLQEILKEKEQQLGIPIQVILGNHDRTEAFYEGFLQEEPQDKYYYKKTFSGVDNYFLDTTFGNIEQGYIDEKQLTWLKENLVQNQDKPALIFMHHPIAGASLRYMRFSVLQNGDDLIEVCKNGNVKGIFAGHIHFATTYTTENIVNGVAESTAYHIDCRNHKIHYVSDAVGYNIITLSAAYEVGIENQMLLWNSEVVKEISIGQTDFVNLKELKK
ncbi:metallophosphoesterase family protein [Liquorilactobacillus hordei]|uniref:Metallophosphoesterase n=1 Tax=Liquorilactobacillus hordei TaxID=468911 RepID=A0A3Q8CY47_9LACO|nr:metallophosphoesterase [Liquorilactobacillus hordei]AUJ30550.1 metallophosphoesterase [Liquorilactobacillus hordei]